MITRSVDYLRQKFESRINKTEDGHWIWTATKNRSDGYGQLMHYGKPVYAHRLAMYFYKGFDLNSDSQVNHKPECNISACCNPEHLYLGNQSDNMKDRVVSGTHNHARKTHCPKGHEYSGANLIVYGNNRQCWKCSIERSKRQREKKRAQNA